jgi:hypothetical protein
LLTVVGLQAWHKATSSLLLLCHAFQPHKAWCSTTLWRIAGSHCLRHLCASGALPCTANMQRQQQ